MKTNKRVIFILILFSLILFFSFYLRFKNKESQVLFPEGDLTESQNVLIDLCKQHGLFLDPFFNPQELKNLNCNWSESLVLQCECLKNSFQKQHTEKELEDQFLNQFSSLTRNCSNNNDLLQNKTTFTEAERANLQECFQLSDIKDICFCLDQKKSNFSKNNNQQTNFSINDFVLTNCHLNLASLPPMERIERCLKANTINDTCLCLENPTVTN